jgi:subtilisin family serine protease
LYKLHNMRNLYVLITVLFVINSSNLRAQNDNILYVVLNNYSPLPACNQCNYTSNTTLDNIFNLYNVYEYDKAFDGFTNTLLQRTYFVKCTGNIDSLLIELITTGYFDTVIMSPTYIHTGGCPNPVTVNDPWVSLRWSRDTSLYLSDAFCAWTLTKGNPNLNIAVVDTEIDTTHIDYNDKVTLMTPNTTPNGPSHGMRTTGVVCAQTNNNEGSSSIGYDLKVKFYSVNSHGMYNSIRDAYRNGAKVINVSYVIGWDPIGIELIKEITQNGCTVVFGAGNWPGTYHQGIWDIPGVIIVSGVNQDNSHASTIVHPGGPHSSYPGVDLCAFSIDILTVDYVFDSLTMSWQHGYRGGWGTSFAAPQVTATVGLMLSVNPCLSPSEIEDIIKASTDPIADAHLYTGLIGTGRLNVYKAVKKAYEWGNSNLEVFSGENKTLSNVMMYDNIYVRSGGTLNITNTTIYMDSMGIIVVEPGAILFINNSTITSAPVTSCKPNSIRWSGFRIEGAPSLDQIPSTNQGRLYLNNAIIRNAVNAVATYGVNTNGSIKWHTAGGAIIQAYHSHFMDNQRHLEFLSYKRPGNKGNLSHFVDCSFESYANKDISQPPYYNNTGTMITAWDVHGVTFTACEFKNLNGSDDAEQHTTDRGTGIFLYDATFIINGQVNPANCAITKRGVFDDLHYGLNGYYSPSNTLAGKLMVSRQDFTLNDRSIQLNNGVTPSIFKNHFSLDIPSQYYHRAQSQYDWTLMYTGISGITTYGTAGALVEQNEYEFNGTESANANEVIVSTVFDNSLTNGGGGRYRLNQIAGTLIGAQTQHNNTALQLTCNQFAQTLNALKLNPLGGNATPEFGYCVQGTRPEDQALRSDYNNTFISNNPFDATHYPNYVKTYVIKDGEPNRPDPGKVLRVDVNNCNSEGIVVEKEDCQPTKALFEICHEELEWPDPNRNNYYMLKGRRNAINDSLENELYDEGEIAQAQSDLKYYNIEATQAKNQVLWAYNVLSVLDSTVNYTDSIITFLANETDVHSRKQLIATYYAIGDYSNASQYLTALPQTTDELIQFKAYYELLIAIAVDERNIYQLNSEEIAALQAIAATQSSAAHAAQGILTLVNGEVFDYVIERLEDDDLFSSNHASNALQKNESIQHNHFDVFPNPANNSFVVKYEIDKDTQDERTIQLTDITGKIIFSKTIAKINGNIEISTASYSNGLYFIQLYSGSSIVAVTKIIIHH